MWLKGYIANIIINYPHKFSINCLSLSYNYYCTLFVDYNYSLNAK